jgi:ornithine carbamoyltransferase
MLRFSQKESMKKDLLSIADLNQQEIHHLFDRAHEMKTAVREKGRLTVLNGRVMALVFEKPSLRTRVTFETGIIQMGGAAIYLAPGDIGLGKRETVPDVAQNLSRWVHIIVARTFAHETVVGLAENARIPVVNALCNLEHPCQALADFLTILEHRRSLKGAVLTWVGDGNNVCHSLMLSAGLLGVNMKVATPAGYEPKAEYVSRAREFARSTGAQIELFTDPKLAAKDAEFIYTDTWTSMGDEAQAEIRKKAFAPYQVNAELLSLAGKGCKVMHCLPAHRGDEITADVLDGPNSIVLDEAENRLHIQRAIVAELVVKNLGQTETVPTGTFAAFQR